MLVDWKDRIDGIKRIVLALGVMSLCAIMSQNGSTQRAGAVPETVLTENAQLADCTAEQLETTVGRFDCAVVLNPKVKSSSVQFLSAEGNGGAAGNEARRMFKQP